MKNIILIVSLLLMGVSSRADILNSSDNKNVADKFDPMLKAALFQMKIIADTSSILLSDIDGLFTDDPHKNPDAKLIKVVDKIDTKLLGMAKGSTGSDVGTGGMATKLTAAKIATYSGADMIIANGGNMGILYDIMNDRYTGTLFHRAKDAEFVLADYIQREMAPTSTGGQ